MTKQPVEFGSFDPQAEVDVKQRNLPHWFQPGVAMFVTFRTADSLPKEVLLSWQHELEQWLETRVLPTALATSGVQQKLPSLEILLAALSAIEQKEFRRLSDRLFHRSLDECHGACLLRNSHLAAIVADCLRFFDGERYDLDRFVIMPNHIHMIAQFHKGESLKSIGHSWMRYSARQINEQRGVQGAFWQPEAFDHLIRSPEQYEYL